MRAFTLALLLVLGACSGQPAAAPDATGHENAQRGSSATGGASGNATALAAIDFSTPATIAPEIAAAWSGVRIRVVDRERGSEETFDIPLNGADLLGESGLVLSAGIFLPDFILDENGITSRSAAPINPAVRVVISEDGVEDFEGWLFAAMPEIRPYPNPRYEVLLVEGIPAR